LRRLVEAAWRSYTGAYIEEYEEQFEDDEE
jgi:hypothetical protein